MKSTKIIQVAITSSCKRLVLIGADNSRICLDFQTIDACFVKLEELKATLTKFDIRDVATGFVVSSQRGALL